MCPISSFYKMQVGYISCLRHFFKKISLFILFPSLFIACFFPESSLNWRHRHPESQKHPYHSPFSVLLQLYQIPILRSINKCTLLVMHCESESQGKSVPFYDFLIVREGAFYQDKLSSYSQWWIQFKGGNEPIIVMVSKMYFLLQSTQSLLGLWK